MGDVFVFVLAAVTQFYFSRYTTGNKQVRMKQWTPVPAILMLRSENVSIEASPSPSPQRIVLYTVQRLQASVADYIYIGFKNESVKG